MKTIYFINKQYIILGGKWNGCLCVLNTESDKEVESYSVHSDTITCVAIDEKEKIIITGARNGEVVGWNIRESFKLK